MRVQEAVFIRFPSGFREMTFAAAVPRVGDTLKRGNDAWEVTAVEKDASGATVVTLGPAKGSDGKPEKLAS